MIKWSTGSIILGGNSFERQLAEGLAYDELCRKAEGVLVHLLHEDVQLGCNSDVAMTRLIYQESPFSLDRWGVHAGRLG